MKMQSKKEIDLTKQQCIHAIANCERTCRWVTVDYLYKAVYISQQHAAGIH